MSVFQNILNAHNGDQVSAAITVGRDLMKGDPASFKAGYTAANALLAVRDLYGLDAVQLEYVSKALEQS